MTTLVVTLSRALPTAAMRCEGVLSDDGLTVLRAVQAPAALLPAPSGADIVAVVPACRLSWHRLALPRGALNGGLFQDGNAGRLRAVLDGLVEFDADVAGADVQDAARPAVGRVTGQPGTHQRVFGRKIHTQVAARVHRNMGSFLHRYT